MNLQNPKKFKLLIDQANQVAINVLRPISRKYDKAEHSYPKELDRLASLVDGMNEGGEGMNAGAAVGKRGTNEQGNKNGVNFSTALSVIEMCYGDTALLLSMPRQGLGNSAIAAVAKEEQVERFAHTCAAKALAEPHGGSAPARLRPRLRNGRLRTDATGDFARTAHGPRCRRRRLGADRYPGSGNRRRGDRDRF